MFRSRSLPALALALTALVAATACGGGSHTSAAVRPGVPPGPCTAAARTPVAAWVGTPAASVTATPFTAPNGAAGCRFAARPPAAGPVGVVAMIDSAPQAEQRFERAVVEYGQNVLWSHAPTSAYPLNIVGLGVGADWFPADSRLLATDASRLVDITVMWSGAAVAPRRRLAEALARGYLAKPTG